MAELLNLTSQDVMALLKKEHGIEVKSASSTIEEVVAREFVGKQARQRNIKVPSNASFADTPSPAARGGLKRPGARAPEPAKPVAPVAAPRLVKTAKPAAAIETPAAAPLTPEPFVAAAPEPAEVEAPPAPEPEAPAVAEAPPVETAAAPTPAKAEPPAPAPIADHPAPPAAHHAPAAAAPPPAVAARPAAPVPGRIVPPTLRLRVEDPKTGQAPPAPPRRPLLVRPPASTTPPAAATGNLSKPAAPAPRPGGPAAPRPGGPPRAGAYPRPQAPMGGPRPLPSQPVRPSQPLRPNVPGYRPPPPRPSGPRSSGVRRDPRPQAPTQTITPPPPVTRTITLAEGMTVSDLALKLDVKAKDVLKKLMDKRMMMTINSTLDNDTSSMIAREFGADVKMQTFEEELLQVETEESNPEDIVTRGPVVTVMGHVDHGKTTLLDAIRETRVAEREAGGITQHIGAYAVQVNDRNVVFLDTPGHEAFTMMRARGARVTDVVVLVVAADDGVMPQTREAIDHARAANVPILVAINKIDKPNANPDRVKKELSDLGLVPEDWGGQTVTVPLSAKKRENIPALLEMVLLVTELSELKANPKRNASGTVLEAKLDKGRGPVATILVQDGTLRVGDTLIAGTIVGKVRALIDDRGKPIKSAGPSTPVEVLGLGGLPSPGDAFQALADAAKARQIAHYRVMQAKDKAHRRRRHQRVGRAARRGLERHHHRLQRPARPQRGRRRRPRRRRYPPSLRHLQRHRRDEEGDDRAARSDAEGSAHRHGAGSRPVQDAEVRHHRGLYGHRGAHRPLGRHAGAPAARRRRRPRGQDRVAPALQGRRVRGQGGLRVRHRLREVQRHQGRRRHRGLRGGAHRGYCVGLRFAVCGLRLTVYS